MHENDAVDRSVRLVKASRELLKKTAPYPEAPEGPFAQKAEPEPREKPKDEDD